MTPLPPSPESDARRQVRRRGPALLFTCALLGIGTGSAHAQGKSGQAPGRTTTTTATTTGRSTTVTPQGAAPQNQTPIAAWMTTMQDATAVVQQPKNLAEEPNLGDRQDGTTLSLSAGALIATGNSRLIAVTVNGEGETRWGDNAVGLFLLGNYGRSAAPEQPETVTTENLQARLRYERYLSHEASLFLINSGRHDRFQGVELRYNLDPGFKYLLLKLLHSSFWVEAGYDLQYDVRRSDALLVENPDMTTYALSRTQADHSVRAFVGFKHAFSSEVALSTGAEYLQSVLEADQYRVNYDLLFTAKVGGGLAVGLGFSTRFDHRPLPGKQQVDTATTVSLIYALDTRAKPAAQEAKCKCPPAPPCAGGPPPAPVRNITSPIPR